MKTMLKKVMVLGAAAAFLMSCSAEDPIMENASVNETAGLNHSYDIQNEDLVGTWNLVSMVSDSVDVDLNLDQTWSRDILSETQCFKQMSFTFDLVGKVKTQQAKLFFKTAENRMECQTGTYDAAYEVIGNVLKIGFNFNGLKVYETRNIDVVEENGAQYLEMTLTYAEAKHYINDPEFVSPTGATDVKAITMLFKKQ